MFEGGGGELKKKEEGFSRKIKWGQQPNNNNRVSRKMKWGQGVARTVFGVAGYGWLGTELFCVVSCYPIGSDKLSVGTLVGFLTKTRRPGVLVVTAVTFVCLPFISFTSL